MLNFGKVPPRQLKCFGVSGLLADKCYVFYDNFFSTKNLGRISDLVAARLAKTGVDDLRLRALLLFSVFESYRNRSKEASASGMSFECGIDGEKIAFGVSFVVDTMPDLDGMPERVALRQPKGGFEELLREIDSQAERVLVRTCVETREVEIIALIGIPDRIDTESAGKRQPIVVLPLSSTEAESEPPVAQSYIQLADLDYDQMLRETPPGVKAARPSTGELLSVSAADIEKQETIRVAGEAQEKERVVRISGDGGVGGTDNTMIKIAGTEKYVERIKELEERIAELEAGGAAGSAKDGAEGEGVGVTAGIGEFLKNIWPFRRGKAEEEKKEEPAAEGEEKKDDLEDVSPKAASSEPGKAAVDNRKVETARARRKRSSSEKSAEAVDDLVEELDGGQLDRTLARAQKEAAAIAKDSRSKQWVDGLMKELVAEKAGLRDMAQKLNQSIKLKEHEFKGQMQGLQEELRKRDEALKQKNTALNRAKEQLAVTSANLEKVKTSGAGGADEVQFKQKYGMTLKLLNATKDENQALQKKVDEFKTKLDAATMKSRGAASAEVAAAKTKADRLQRQVEEFKRTNHELAEKLNEANNSKKAAVVGNADELKKRLEAAVKMSTVAQKEADQLSLRVEELQREEARLKKELERANTELKFLKSGKKSGTPPKAA
jgi:hypothetical protein